MSTTAERALEHLAKSITRAFATFGLKIKCETVGTKSLGYSGTGLRLTIGDRVLTVDEGGGIVSIEEDGKPMDLRTLAREPLPPAKRKEQTEKAKVGDFSKVDWGGHGR